MRGADKEDRAVARGLLPSSRRRPFIPRQRTSRDCPGCSFRANGHEKNNGHKKHERFQQAALDLGFDEAEGVEALRSAFEKIVPPKSRPPDRS